MSVFDERMRGLGEGDYPWRTVPAGQHSMMTDGTVATPRPSMMTNGTVGVASGGDVKDDQREVQGRIADDRRDQSDADIIRVASGDAKLLARDASVFVSATPGSHGLSANVAVVGKNGTRLAL